MITVTWLKHLSGHVVRVLLDYVDHVSLCSKLKAVLMEQQQWADICRLQGAELRCAARVRSERRPELTLLPPPENPRCLQHLCRLRIRQSLGRRRLRSPVFMSFVPLPRRLKDYILYREYDLLGLQPPPGPT